MGQVNLLAVLLGTAVFFVLGAVWYGPLFGTPWKDALGYDAKGERPGPRSRRPVWLTMVLAFLLELVVVFMLGHLIARTLPPPHVIMMMATGFGFAIMAPAVGINYLFQERPWKLFWIEAGYYVVGMTLVGAVFCLLA